MELQVFTCDTMFLKNAQMDGPSVSSVFKHTQVFTWSTSLPSWKSVERTKNAFLFGEKNGWTQQSFSKVIFTFLFDTAKTTKLPVRPQKKIHVASLCHGQRQCNPEMTYSPKWPAEVMGEGRTGMAALYSRMAAVFSHSTGTIIPATLGHKKQARCPMSAQVLRHGQKDVHSPGLQPSTGACSWSPHTRCSWWK